MSLAARRTLVISGHLVFQNPEVQKADLLDPTKTTTELIAAMIYLTAAKGHYIEVTAVHSDHHPDGLRGHQGGRAFDGWPLASPKAGDYLDANDPRFTQYIKDVANMPFEFQLGLAGSAITPANVAAAGPTYFPDSGGDHVHHGVT